jgi:hypothetical protein
MKFYLMDKKCYNNNGYILLFSVLLVGVVASTIVASSLVVGMDASRTGFTKLNSAQAGKLADACGEQALQRISDDQNFSGTESSELANGTCQYTVYDLGGQDRRIEAMGIKHNNTKRILIEIDQTRPSINITSWQEVADF